MVITENNIFPKGQNTFQNLPWAPHRVFFNKLVDGNSDNPYYSLGLGQADKRVNLIHFINISRNDNSHYNTGMIVDCYYMNGLTPNLLARQEFVAKSGGTIFTVDVDFNITDEIILLLKAKNDAGDPTMFDVQTNIYVTPVNPFIPPP